MHDAPALDRRKVRTIAALRTALLELIVEKRYDEITVQEIIERANVGRSTFYSHFRDKEDLLVGDWKKFLGLVAMHVDVSAEHGHVAPVEGLMMHLRDFHALYRGLERSGKTERLFALGIDFLAEKIQEQIETRAAEMTVPPAVCAHFLSLQIFGLLKWWLDRNMPIEPNEMGRIFNDLVAPGIRNVWVR